MDCTRFGNKLTYYREKNDMTEKDLARKLHVTTGTVVKLELSEKEPSMALVSRISRLFGVDFSQYLDMDEKHRGAHHFDMDDPEYSPLSDKSDKKTRRIKIEKRSFSRPDGNDALRKILSKIFIALGGLLIVFLEDIAVFIFGDKSLGMFLIPLAFILVIAGTFMGKKR